VLRLIGVNHAPGMVEGWLGAIPTLISRNTGLGVGSRPPRTFLLL